jgi:hypothetical protein
MFSFEYDGYTLVVHGIFIASIAWIEKAIPDKKVDLPQPFEGTAMKEYLANTANETLMGADQMLSHLREVLTSRISSWVRRTKTKSGRDSFVFPADKTELTDAEIFMTVIYQLTGDALL